VAVAMIGAGHLEDAMAVSEELSIPFLRASVLAEAAAALKGGDRAGGRAPQDLISAADALLNTADAPISWDKVVAGRAAVYGVLARAQAAHGDKSGAQASLQKAHTLVGQVTNAADQITVLLAIAGSESAIYDPVHAGQTIDRAIALADDGTEFYERIDLYPDIVLQQVRLEGQTAAAETVLHMFSFYYPHLGGTQGTVTESIKYPITIAELMGKLGIDRFDSTPLPQRKP
jgi:hypothetical protein